VYWCVNNCHCVLKESCLTNEFGKLRPRKCNYKFCAFCEKLPNPKSIVMKGFCDSVTEEDFIFYREYYPDGIKNGRVYFRYTDIV
jgi:hypothetical protein